MALERGGGGGKVQAGAKRTPATTTTAKQSYTSPAGSSPSTRIFGTGGRTSGFGASLATGGYTAGAPTAQPFGGGGGGGGGGYDIGGGGGGGALGAIPAPAVTPPSEEDYLSGDAGFQTQSSALQAALQRFLADSDFQRNTYETDYGKSIRDLGWQDEDGDGGNPGKWNWNDQLTASGRGYQNQLNDFGSRGMLQSSGYADAFNELQRMLGQQHESIKGSRTNFMTDLENQIANFKGENTANQQSARAEALQRRAAQYAL